jgi:restriction system protein
MSRKPTHRRRDRSTQCSETAVKVLVLGVAFLVVPLLLGSTSIGRALSGVWPIGLLMIAGGAFLIWLGRLEAPSSAGPQGTGQVRGSPGPVAAQCRGGRSPAKAGDNVVQLFAASGDVGSGSAPADIGVLPAARSSWSADVFMEMVDWRRFEALVEALFAQAGFETRSQSHGADGGIDIWLYSRCQPGTPVSIVQCKHWSGRRVGVDKVRELRGVMAAHDVKRGQFATTSRFSDEAIAFARDNGINLLDVDGLLALIGKRTAEQQQELLDVAYEGEYWRPTCVNCGIKLVERRPKSGAAPFWGCTNFPRCKTTMQMRAD